ncbi:hypothetical protein FJZ23_00870 [Candidatus Parcubacteria bacterium]|nr:hypothetical protein [Candidatus Parcubacteria bacterium]
MAKHAVTFALVGIFVYAQLAHGAMSSTNYEIRWDTVSTGGSDTSSSASYLLRDTTSGTAGATGSSANYQVADGYRVGIFDRVISFDLYIQGNTREITGFAGTTVTMGSTAGLAANDYVAIVEDRTTGQVVGFGRISSVAIGSISLDRLTTDGRTPTIDGSDDYLYVMNGSSLTMTSPSANDLGFGLAAFEVTVDNDSGYTVQVYEDGDLRNGNETVADVADGSVAAGSEEFGARSSDTTLAGSTFDTQDSAISGTAQDIATSSTFAFGERNFLRFRLSANTGTTALVYANTMTFIASGNF